MKTNFLFPALCFLLIFLGMATFHGCDIAGDEQIAPGAATHDISLKRRPPNPPPPPPPVYFGNCSYAEPSGPMLTGQPTSITLTLTYINSPGGSYPASTSTTVNGVYFTSPAGTLNVGSGNITFTAHGTPTAPGFHLWALGVQGVIPCQRVLGVQNAPPQGPCSDPDLAEGSIGCVTFTYQGEEVTYQTVRGRDGKIWFQHNLGSPQVPFNYKDEGSYGHYFQWGRWDDGHQVPTGPGVTGSSSLQNPSHIPNGNGNFIKGVNGSTAWWTNGAASNTWSSSAPSTINGFDPGTVVGPGWHIPTEEEWYNAFQIEGIFDSHSAFGSNLKLTESGYRAYDSGTYWPNWTGGNYWTSTATANGTGRAFMFDDAYNASIQSAYRGYGFNVRLVKD